MAKKKLTEEDIQKVKKGLTDSKSTIRRKNAMQVGKYNLVHLGDSLYSAYLEEKNWKKNSEWMLISLSLKKEVSLIIPLIYLLNEIIFIKNTNKMDSTLYVNYYRNKKEFIDFLVDFFDDCVVSFNTIQYKNFEFHISYNDEYDESKSLEFPDGFLYFKYLLDVEYDDDNENLFIEMLNKLLKILWNENIPSVASSDYEKSLIEEGGYKSKKIPWNIVKE